MIVAQTSHYTIMLRIPDILWLLWWWLISLTFNFWINMCHCYPSWNICNSRKSVNSSRDITQMFLGNTLLYFCFSSISYFFPNHINNCPIYFNHGREFFKFRFSSYTVFINMSNFNIHKILIPQKFSFFKNCCFWIDIN